MMGISPNFHRCNIEPIMVLEWMKCEMAILTVEYKYCT